MSTQKISYIVNKLTDNKAKTKRILLGCYKEQVKSNLYKQYLLYDLKKFLEWSGLGGELGVDGMLYGVDELEDVIDQYLSKRLGSENVRYRMKYNVIKIINFMKLPKNSERINKYFDKLGKSKSLEDVFSELDSLFLDIYGKPLEYYENIYRDYIKRLINSKYNIWSRPKFQIIDKYGVLQDLNKASKAMKRAVRDEFKLGGVIEGDEKLERLQKYVDSSMDTVLKSDYQIIDTLMNTDESELTRNIKGIWFRIFTWMKNKKPSKVTRNGVIVLFLYLVTDDNINRLIRNALEKDIDIEPSAIRDKNSSVYKIMYDIIDNVVGMGIYRKKLIEYVNPKLDYTRLFAFINRQDVTNKNKIIDEILRQTEGLSHNQQKEKIYRILKPYKKQFKITREIIEKLLN